MKATTTAIAALSMAFAASTFFAVKFYCELRENEPPRAEVLKAAQEKSAEAAAAAPKRKGEVSELVIYGMQQDRWNSDRIELKVSEYPDLEVLRNYVTVEPMNRGSIAFSIDSRTNWNTYEKERFVVIAGDFAYRTNVTLRVRAGLPSKSPDKVAPLAKDFVRIFVRADEKPRVDFTDFGRYLPPIGRREIAFDSVNMTNISVLVRRVPSANIVEMLALEEEAYEHIDLNFMEGSRFAFVKDLSAISFSKEILLHGVPNVKQKSVLSLLPTDGGTSNGVFLVEAQNVGHSSSSYKVVCISDIGITAHVDKRSVCVWATSLTTGKPVPDAMVEVYSTANILVAKGETLKDGYCVCERMDKGEPFAVVVKAKDGTDLSFIALRDSSKISANASYASRKAYPEKDELTAFLWTDRGIYRHGEKIFAHSIVRNGSGVAPKEIPLELALKSPNGKILNSVVKTTDAMGALSHDEMFAPEDQPSGSWELVLKVPGKKGLILAVRPIKIEEFVPPQIRVKVDALKTASAKDFSFEISAEHLYGGPAKDLFCEGRVYFDEAAFSPVGWNGWSFGSEGRTMNPRIVDLQRERLDANGKFTYAAPLPSDSKKPSAAIRASAQGAVLEDGGREVCAIDSAIVHYYPYYIGTTLKEYISKPEDGFAKVSVACVAPDGKSLADTKKLTAKLETVSRIFVYNFHKSRGAWANWDSEEVRTVFKDSISIVVESGSIAEFELPVEVSGDYVLTIRNEEDDVEFSKRFYLGEGSGSQEVRTSLAKPSDVTITTDKEFYRVGEKPKLVIKSPFPGYALLSVTRDGMIYSQVIEMTNATEEVELQACDKSWWPNVEVSISVVREGRDEGFAIRAHGMKTIMVRPSEMEIPVDVGLFVTAPGSQDAKVRALVSAPGADSAVITLVDEGINILTSEPVPNPAARFFKAYRMADPFGFHDLYSMVLPVIGADALKETGFKTGGGFGPDLFSRVSPVPTRRFKPLSKWEARVPVNDGKASAEFAIPEFVGEVRVTAVAYSGSATGSAAARRKITPKLVIEPDAPRFVAPNDVFVATLPMVNKSGAVAEVVYSVTNLLDGTCIASGRETLQDDTTRVVSIQVTSPETPGEIPLLFSVAGCGESHAKTILLPVRPAMPWVCSANVETLEANETFEIPANEQGSFDKFDYKVCSTPAAKYAAAFKWLEEYPYGCLEQTASKIFPLIKARPLMEAVGIETADNLERTIAVGVARIFSMFRADYTFSMWPGASSPAWDEEVPLYAAHCFVEAARSGVEIAESKTAMQCMAWFLKSRSRLDDTALSAYACHTLALMGKPDKDKMLLLYDSRDKLSVLSRARLARAFVAIADRKRAEVLLEDLKAPEGVKDAAATMLALLELDPSDKRLPALLRYIESTIPSESGCWLTTTENAYALMAASAWYAAHPVKSGKPNVIREGSRLRNLGDATAFVAWRKLSLMRPEDDRDEASELTLKRTYSTIDGKPYDLSKAARGDLVVVGIEIKSSSVREYSDLVIEDLLPGAFEPLPLRRLLGGGANASTKWVANYDIRDDRVIVFSGKFALAANGTVKFEYPVRIVSAGRWTLPGATVEAMYFPGLRARIKSGELLVNEK